MTHRRITFIGFTLFLTLIASSKVYEFPESFKIGAASSSYQIEGAWNLDGKSPNIWDTFVHTRPDLILDGSNADVGADSYHFYKDDVKALKDAGLQVYRFSVSWARIIPESGTINLAGIDYYNKLIDELISNDIEPLITIFHWDLPQYIQDQGGFLDPVIVEYFVRYADVLFKNFGDRVKRWITFNEPFIFCVDKYPKVIQLDAPGIAEYLCGHHLMAAHAAAYKLYNSTYRQEQNGQVGICLYSNFFYPDKDVDPQLVDSTLQFQLGWFANPIYTTSGGYPAVMVDQISKKSASEGRLTSRLPQMNLEMKNALIGSADFLAINYYTSRIIAPAKQTVSGPSWYNDKNVDYIIDKNWKQAKADWLHNVPEGLHDLLKWIKEKYNNPTVLVTENGWSDDGTLEDDDRIDYLKGHLASISKAITEDKCRVIAYTVWSILDNFEWTKGFTDHFGIYAVNLTSPTKARIAKKSVGFFKEFTKTRRFEN